MPTEPVTVIGPYIQGEIPDPWVEVFKDANGLTLNLTGYTNPQWHIRRHLTSSGFPWTATDPTVIVRTAVVNPDQTPPPTEGGTGHRGEVTYTWVAADMAIPGDWEGEFWITGPGGTPIRAAGRYAWHVALSIDNPTGIPDPGPDGSTTLPGRLTLLKDFVRSQRTITEAELVAGVNASLQEDVLVTLTASRVMGLPTNAVAGQRLHLIITEGGAGNFALTFNAGISVTNFALNLAAGAKTEATLTCLDATHWLLALNPPSTGGVPFAKGGLNFDVFENAPVLDGVTDASPAVRTTRAAANGKGVVFFPDAIKSDGSQGSYYFASRVLLAKNDRLLGTSRLSSVGANESRILGRTYQAATLSIAPVATDTTLTFSADPSLSGLVAGDLIALGPVGTGIIPDEYVQVAASYTTGASVPLINSVAQSGHNTSAIFSNALFEFDTTITNAGTAAIAIEGLNLAGGFCGIYAPNGGVWFTLRDTNIGSNFASVLARGFVQQWFFSDTLWSGGRYGYLSGLTCRDTPASGVHDKSYFFNCYANGQGRNAWNIQPASPSTGNNCTWWFMTLVTSANDAVVLGSERHFVFINVNTEGNGDVSGLPAPTTATGTSGTNTVVVASAAGLVIGQTATIAGGLASGFDYVDTITNVVGTTITLNSNLGANVASADFTVAKYCDFIFTGTTPGQNTWINASVGNSSNIGGNLSRQRYSIDASGLAAGGTFINGGSSSRPIYDPTRVMSLFACGSATTIRRTAGYGGQPTGRLTSLDTGGGSPQALIGSPPGKDIEFQLQDSTSNQAGTCGTLIGRRSDGNRSRFIQIDSWGHLTPAMATGAPTTTSLNAHVSSATPSGSDQSGKITIVVDGTGVAAGQTLFTVTYGQALAIQWGQILLVDASTDTTLATVRFHAASLTGSTYQVVCDQALVASKTYIVSYMAL